MTALPSDAVGVLNRTYGERFATLGVRVARARFVEAGDYGSTPDDGPHLAIYVEPLDDAQEPAYIDNIALLARTVVPDAFQRWPRLASLDICQEPTSGVDPRPEPEPETALVVLREQMARVDWRTVDTAGLWRASRASPPRVSLMVSDRIAQAPQWAEITSSGDN